MNAEGGRPESFSPLCGDHDAVKLAEVRARCLVVVRGEIVATSHLPIGSSPAYRCVLSDGTGEVSLLFLGRRSVSGLEVGTRCSATGRVAAHELGLVLWNPRYDIEA